MKATLHTDYAMRLLIYLMLHPEERVGTRVVAEAYDVSLNHLNKVSQHLVHLGVLEGTRGRGGGVMLKPESLEIKLGDLVRSLEPEGEIAQCAGAGSNEPCKIGPSCHLRGMFAGASMAFYQHLNQFKIKDLVAENASQMKALLAH